MPQESSRKKVKAAYLISCSDAYSITHITSLRQLHDLIQHFFFLGFKRNEKETKKQKWKKYLNNKHFCASYSWTESKHGREKSCKNRWKYLHACVWRCSLFIAQLSSLPSRFSPLVYTLCPRLFYWVPTVSGFKVIYLTFYSFWVFFCCSRLIIILRRYSD